MGNSATNDHFHSVTRYSSLHHSTLPIAGAGKFQLCSGLQRALKTDSFHSRANTCHVDNLVETKQNNQKRNLVRKRHCEEITYKQRGLLCLLVGLVISPHLNNLLYMVQKCSFKKYYKMGLLPWSKLPVLVG